MGIDWKQTANAIKRRREKRQLTQDKLAAKIGCRLNTIARLEIGDRRPSIDILEKIARVLECRVRDLLKEEKPMLTVEEKREPSFLGAPNFIRAGLRDAAAQGVDADYASVGFSFSQLLNNGDLSEAAFEELREICRLNSQADFTESLLKFVDQEFPACMQLIPSRRKRQFLKGVIYGLADGRGDIQPNIAVQIMEQDRERTRDRQSDR